jgi:hypothetical protein
MSNCESCGCEEDKPFEFLECDSCGASFCSGCLQGVSEKEAKDYSIEIDPAVREDVLDETEDGEPVTFHICFRCHPSEVPYPWEDEESDDA